MPAKEATTGQTRLLRLDFKPKPKGNQPFLGSPETSLHRLLHQFQLLLQAWASRTDVLPSKWQQMGVILIMVPCLRPFLNGNDLKTKHSRPTKKRPTPGQGGSPHGREILWEPSLQIPCVYCGSNGLGLPFESRETGIHQIR